MERELPPLADLQSLCEEWQKRLFLRDWTVFIKIVSPRNAIGNSSGQIDVNEPHKTAYISITSDLIEVKVENLPWWDCEHLIVHELLHLHLWSFHIREDTPEGVAEEQAINALARVLISLKRA